MKLSKAGKVGGRKKSDGKCKFCNEELEDKTAYCCQKCEDKNCWKKT